VRRLQVSPSLGQFAAGDSPDHDPRELDLLPRLAIGRAPRIPHNHLVAFGDNVFDGYVNIRKALESRRQILLRAFRSRRRAGWSVRAVLLIVRREVAVRRGQILTIHEILKVAANEVLGFFRVHHGATRTITTP